MAKKRDILVMDLLKENDVDEDDNIAWLRNIIVHRIRGGLGIATISMDSEEYTFLIDWWGQADAYCAQLIECDATGFYHRIANDTLTGSEIRSIQKWMRNIYGLEHVHVRAKVGSEERVYNVIGRPILIER